MSDKFSGLLGVGTGSELSTSGVTEPFSIEGGFFVVAVATDDDIGDVTGFCDVTFFVMLTVNVVVSGSIDEPDSETDEPKPH